MIRSKDNFFKTSDGTQIYFEEHGQGQAIILVPGFLCTSKFFARNIPELSKNNRLILLDSRGHGSSDKTLQNLTIPRCAQDIKELIEYLGLDNVLLVGWSLGSSIILSYWEQFGRYKICALGVTDSTLYPFADADWNSHSLRGFNLDAFNVVMSRAIDNHEAYCQGFAKAVWQDDKVSAAEIVWVAEEMRKTPPWIAFALYSDFLHRDYVSVLRTVTVPIFVCGADSLAIPKGVAMAKSYMQHIQAPSELHIFEHGGHMLFYVEAEKYNQVILDFIAKVSPNKSEQ